MFESIYKYFLSPLTEKNAVFCVLHLISIVHKNFTAFFSVHMIRVLCGEVFAWTGRL